MAKLSERIVSILAYDILQLGAPVVCEEAERIAKAIKSILEDADQGILDCTEEEEIVVEKDPGDPDWMDSEDEDDDQPTLTPPCNQRKRRFSDQDVDVDVVDEAVQFYRSPVKGQKEETRFQQVSFSKLTNIAVIKNNEVFETEVLITISTPSKRETVAQWDITNRVLTDIKTVLHRSNEGGGASNVTGRRPGVLHEVFKHGVVELPKDEGDRLQKIVSAMNGKIDSVHLYKRCYFLHKPFERVEVIDIEGLYLASTPRGYVFNKYPFTLGHMFLNLHVVFERTPGVQNKEHRIRLI